MKRQIKISRKNSKKNKLMSKKKGGRPPFSYDYQFVFYLIVKVYTEIDESGNIIESSEITDQVEKDKAFYFLENYNEENWNKNLYYDRNTKKDLGFIDLFTPVIMNEIKEDFQDIYENAEIDYFSEILIEAPGAIKIEGYMIDHDLRPHMSKVNDTLEQMNDKNIWQYTFGEDERNYIQDRGYYFKLDYLISEQDYVNSFWLKVFDEVSQNYHYYNTFNKAKQYERPKNCTFDEKKELVNLDWEENFDPVSGRPYFYDIVKNESHWSRRLPIKCATFNEESNQEDSEEESDES
jgi:hypothetical protein